MQEIDRTVTRARRNTIGDASRLSAARSPEKDTLVFHSGDLGYFDEEGFLYVVDRVKDVINTGGMQVSGRDVEDALFEHEAVSEVAVVGLPDEKWIEAVSVVVVPKKDDAGTLREDLEEHAREKLAAFKRPKCIFFVEDLPRNAAGKILKCELREEFAGKVSSE